jgi:hypothetical protein
MILFYTATYGWAGLLANWPAHSRAAKLAVGPAYSRTGKTRSWAGTYMMFRFLGFEEAALYSLIERETESSTRGSLLQNLAREPALL